MSFKTTIIIALILAALGGYAYYDYKSGQKKDEAKENEKTLFEAKKEDITEIRIEGLEQPVKLVPDRETWKIVEPVQSRADDSTVSRVLGVFASFKYRDIVEEQPKDLSAFGLDKPKLTFHLVLKGKGEKTVMVGSKNPVDASYYMKIGNDPRVYAVENGAQDLITTSFFDLRDKKITDFDSEKVESFSVHKAPEDLEFKKVSDMWRMMKPINFPAAESDITTLLSSLAELRVSKFIDQPGDLDQYGLKSPSMSIDIVQEKGLQQKILFGNKEAESVYCLIEGSNVVALVTDSISSMVNKKPEEWREKKLAVFNRFDAEEVKFHALGKDWIFTKGKEENWNEQSPVKAEIESEKFQDVLEKLETAEISSYGTQTALSSPASLEFTASFKDWQDKASKKHLVFGAVKDNLQEVKNDDYDAVVYVNGALSGEIEKALSDLNPSPATQTSPQTKK